MLKLRCLSTSAVILATAGLQVPALAQTTVKGQDCVVNGESFFAASNIKDELSRLAKADGKLAQSESFKQIAVSGANISSILGFYKSCNPKPTYLISDGAGIDLMNGNCSDENCAVIKSCKSTLLQYLEAMKTGGTKRLLWMIYPDPQGSNWATLKTNQDIWAKVVPAVMATITEPKVTLIDLRPVWAGHYSQYTSDGIHATSAGGTATAEAMWKAMKESNFFDLGPSPTLAMPAASGPFLGRTVAGGDLLLSLSLAQPATEISLRILTASGRPVLSAASRESAGLRTVRFPLGQMASGMYYMTVKAGQASQHSPLLVP
jgi:hypothetical protein